MFIDLSIPLNEKTPIYPGDPKTQIKQAGVLDKDGYNDHYICIGTHVGTHVDAPSHMISGGENIDKIPLEQFSGRGVYIKIKDKKFNIKEIRKISIKKGDIIIFHTSMSEKYYTSEYFDNYPTIPKSIANYLVEKKIKAVGVDMCSPDHPPFAIHKIFLKHKILIIENLINLSLLSEKKFRIFAFPLNVSLDASPARVIAEII